MVHGRPLLLQGRPEARHGLVDDRPGLLVRLLQREVGGVGFDLAGGAVEEEAPRGAAVEAGPWSFGERQALSLVVAGLPQPYLKTVLTIIGLGQAFPDGSFRVVPDLPRCGMNSVVDFIF